MSVMAFDRPDYLREEEIVLFADSTAKFFDQHAPEARVAKWRQDKIVEREMWREAGAAGLLCLSMPEAYGGGGGDYRHEVVLMETMATKGIDGFGASLHNAIVAPYILHYGSEEQKRRWLPRMASGELVGAIAMSEPGAGSDLQGVRTSAAKSGNQYVLNGQKTFITNGETANLVIVVAKTDPSAGAKGTSLIVVETEETEGFARGRKLDKVGLDAQDTSELFFNEARVPTSNLLGTDAGQGFVQLMQQLPQERLIIAICAVAAMERAIELTVDYTKERKAFGQPLIDFQNTAFKLAERKTEAMIARVFVDWCVERLIAGDLDAVTASMAKWWCAQKQVETVDECLQLHGGYGYMQEYPISQMFVDARIQKIYGGTNEVMKLLIARSL